MKKSLERDKEHAFDAFCKRCLRNEARDMLRRAEVLRRREVPYCEVPPCEAARAMSCRDSYFTRDRAIEVEAIGAEVDVEDDGIARAILSLDQPRRDIILLSYFLGRSDRAIGALTGLPRSTVQHHRASALRLLRDVLTGEVEVE